MNENNRKMIRIVENERKPIECFIKSTTHQPMAPRAILVVIDTLVRQSPIDHVDLCLVLD